MKDTVRVLHITEMLSADRDRIFYYEYVPPC